MSTKMTLQIKSSSSVETENLAEALGRQLRGGEVIELISDLGGGKTTFTRGLARGIGSIDHVSSPTFKVCNIYNGKKLKLYHYDFYRLNEAGLIEHELADALEEDTAVVIVEWASVIQHALPEERLSITIENLDEDFRLITYNYPKQLQYLVDHADTDN